MIINNFHKAEWLKDDVLLPKPLPERYVVVGNAQLGDV